MARAFARLDDCINEDDRPQVWDARCDVRRNDTEALSHRARRDGLSLESLLIDVKFAPTARELASGRTRYALRLGAPFRAVGVCRAGLKNIRPECLSEAARGESGNETGATDPLSPRR